MILFFDTETTGLPLDYNADVTELDNWPRLVQIAWILCDLNLQQVSIETFVVKPSGFTIPEEATSIHGISNEKALATGETLKRVLEEFINACEGVTHIVGHNIEFDEKIVGAELLRLDAENILAGKQKVCTMKSSVQYCAIDSNGSGYRWPSLSELHLKLFGEDFENHHSALSDILATKACFEELVSKNIIPEIGNTKTESNPKTDKVDDKDTEFWIENSRNWIKKKNLKKALTSIDKAIEIGSGYQLANAYYIRAVLNEALDEYYISDINQAIELEPNFVAAIVFRGKHGFWRKAFEDLNRALKIKPNDPEIHFLLGEKKVESISYYDDPMADTPGHPCYENYDYDLEFKDILPLGLEAVKHFTKAIELNPFMAKAYVSRANLRYSLLTEHGILESKTKTLKENILSSIEKDLEKASELHDKPDSETVYQLGRLLELKMESSDALKMYDKAIELAEEKGEINESAYLARGLLRQNHSGLLKNHELAIHDFSKIIEVNESEISSAEEAEYEEDAYYDYLNWETDDQHIKLRHRANSKIKTRDFSGAIQDLEWSQMISEDREVGYLLGVLYLRTENYEEAQAQFLDYINDIAPIADEDYRPYDLRPIWSLNRISNDEILQIAKAFDFLRYSQEQLGEEDQHMCRFYFHKFRGYAYYKIEDWLGAIEQYSIALEINPDDFELYYERNTVRRKIEYLEYNGEDFERWESMANKLYGKDAWMNMSFS